MAGGDGDHGVRAADGGAEPAAVNGAPAESIPAVLGGTFARVPRRARIMGAVAVVYFIGMMTWMVVAFGPRAAVTGPYMWGGLCGGLSGLLLGWTGALYGLAQDGRWTTRWRWRLVPTRMNDMLLVLPTFSLLSAVLAAVGATVLFPLVWREWYLLGGMAPMVMVIVYSTRVTVDSTRFLYTHAREQAAAAERAQAEAADARLHALQAQMNPHFLFNALNTIASLVRTDARAAEATTENLAAILRRTLDRSRSTVSTVEDEADYLRAYLGIEQERFGDRLRVEWEIDPASLPLRIPPMTLQPLAENALKHGIGGRLEGGRMRIAARRTDDRLQLEVEDDGAGFAVDARDGTGLGNLRARLATLYGDRAALTIHRLPRGARVTLDLPADVP
jgi:signal transduction histidine kinase